MMTRWWLGSGRRPIEAARKPKRDITDLEERYREEPGEGETIPVNRIGSISLNAGTVDSIGTVQDDDADIEQLIETNRQVLDHIRVGILSGEIAIREDDDRYSYDLIIPEGRSGSAGSGWMTPDGRVRGWGCPCCWSRDTVGDVWIEVTERNNLYDVVLSLGDFACNACGAC